MCFLSTTFPNAPAHPSPILFDQSLKTTFWKNFFALVVLEFDDSCYVDAKQYHLASTLLTKSLRSFLDESGKSFLFPTYLGRSKEILFAGHLASFSTPNSTLNTSLR